MNAHTKNFVAAAAIAHRALVTFTGNDGEVTLAAAATDVIAGAADAPGGVKAGERVDVVMFGPAEVLAGATLIPGAEFSAGAAGVAAAAGAQIAGRVLVNCDAGDFVRAFINPRTA